MIAKKQLKLKLVAVSFSGSISLRMILVYELLRPCRKISKRSVRRKMIVWPALAEAVAAEVKIVAQAGMVGKATIRTADKAQTIVN